MISAEKGYVNFEILYSGKDNNSIHAIYREYSQDNLARVAYFQNLTFPADSPMIRYKNIQIKVHSSDGEKLTYTVIND